MQYRHQGSHKRRWLLMLHFLFISREALKASDLEHQSSSDIDVWLPLL